MPVLAEMNTIPRAVFHGHDSGHVEHSKYESSPTFSARLFRMLVATETL